MHKCTLIYWKILFSVSFPLSALIYTVLVIRYTRDWYLYKFNVGSALWNHHIFVPSMCKVKQSIKISQKLKGSLLSGSCKQRAKYPESLYFIKYEFIAQGCSSTVLGKKIRIWKWPNTSINYEKKMLCMFKIKCMKLKKHCFIVPSYVCLHF